MELQKSVFYINKFINSLGISDDKMELVYAFLIFVFLYVLIINIGGLFGFYKKAGKSGWKSLVPIYNSIVLLDIIKRPRWWIVFFLLISLVSSMLDYKNYFDIIFILLLIFSTIFNIIIYYDLAKAFGKNIWFAFGLVFLPFIFIPILGLGKSTYTEPVRKIK